MLVKRRKHYYRPPIAGLRFNRALWPLSRICKRPAFTGKLTRHGLLKFACAAVLYNGIATSRALGMCAEGILKTRESDVLYKNLVTRIIHPITPYALFPYAGVPGHTYGESIQLRLPVSGVDFDAPFLFLD